MRPGDLPVVRQVFEWGARDVVYDTLLLVGPLVVLFVAAVGRTVLTLAVAAAYVATFALYVLYRGLRR